MYTRDPVEPSHLAGLPGRLPRRWAGAWHAAAPVVMVLAAALGSSACGGGSGYDGGNGGGDSVSQAEATSLGADAAALGSNAGLVADQAVQTLQAAMGVGTGAGLVCPGGGGASVAVSGGSPASQLNGQFDVGEVYNLSLNGCSAAAGAPALSGTLTVTVVAADAGSTTLAVVLATSLSSTLPAGNFDLTGSFTLVRSVAGNTTTSHVTATQLIWRRSGGARVFTLSAIDLTAAVTRSAAGTLQALTYNGSHSVSVNQSAYSNLGYSVSTTGSVGYDASARPISGSWVVTLPRHIVTLTLTGNSVRLTADFGKNGTIDLDATFPRADLLAAAG